MRGFFLDDSPGLWQAFCFKFYAELFLLRKGDPHHGQGEPEPELVLEENLNVMQPELLELPPAEVMDIGRVPFHLSQLEFHLGLGEDLLLVHPDDPRFLPELPRPAAPARPD